jgi:hypothetical protein
MCVAAYRLAVAVGVVVFRVGGLCARCHMRASGYLRACMHQHGSAKTFAAAIARGKAGFDDALQCVRECVAAGEIKCPFPLRLLLFVGLPVVCVCASGTPRSNFHFLQTRNNSN